MLQSSVEGTIYRGNANAGQFNLKENQFQLGSSWSEKTSNVSIKDDTKSRRLGLWRYMGSRFELDDDDTETGISYTIHVLDSVYLKSSSSRQNCTNWTMVNDFSWEVIERL